jgi:hypothetical protein
MRKDDREEMFLEELKDSHAACQKLRNTDLIDIPNSHHIPHDMKSQPSVFSTMGIFCCPLWEEHSK